jgi:hypothetical protein
MKNSEFENILDECLDRLGRGETLEQCLHSYPEQAAQLEPLLRMSQAVSKASAILPRSEFKARARYEFRSALQAEATKKRLPLFSLKRRWAMALMVVSILLLVGGGVAMAASNSMPDSPLYPVKLVTEQVQLTLTPSDMGKARLCARLTDRRVAEIVRMACKGDVRQAELATERLDKRLAMLAVLVSAQEGGAPKAMMALPPAPAPPPVPAAPPEEAQVAGGVQAEGNGRAELKRIVAYYAANDRLALNTGLGKAPESAKPALRRAIAVSEAGYEEILAALD